MKIASEKHIDTRKAVYGVTALVGAFACLAQAFNLIDGVTADNIGNLLQAIGQLLPTAGVATAAVVLSRQSKTPGVLEPTPEPPSAVDQVITGLQAVIGAQAQASADVDKVAQATKSALGNVPVVGPLVQQVIASVDR